MRKLPRLLLAAAMALTLLLPPTVAPASANEPDRTLWFHHTHTNETAKFTFKRNGQYDKAVLRQMNVFLADWRTKQPTNMDPALFDLLWEIYQSVDGKQPINIVSSYRSPATNAKLRSASANSGVAENSQHMKGKAMDIFIPGVNLSLLRSTAMKFQVGGVGFYPTSGSPFVHVDTGSVRAWPRMTRAQLKKVFPDGKTLHLPTDGKPLSSDGRAYAQAQWTKCHAVPCNGAVTFDTDPGIMVASADGNIAPLPDAAPIPATRPANLYGDAKVMLAAVDEDPAQRVVPTFEVAAPIPIERPGELAVADAAIPATGDYSAWEKLGAPVPAVKSTRIQLATRAPLGAEENGQTALAALDEIDPMPTPRVLMTPKDSAMVTAYVPTNPDPGAEKALKMIIERGTTAAELPELPLKPGEKVEIQTASLGDNTQLKGMFDLTFNALSGSPASQPMQQALADLALSRQPNDSIAARDVELVAPEIDHVNETLVEPKMMTDGFWAELTEAEGYLDKGTELGPLTGRVGFIPDNAAIPAYDRFVTGTPQLVAGL